MPREPEIVEIRNVEIENDSNIKNIYNSTLMILKNKLSVIKIRSTTLHLILKYVMEEVEKTNLKGTEQKEMALKLIREIVIDLTENEDEKVLLGLIDDGTISNMIDLIVDATHGRLNINSLAYTTGGCFKNCIPYLFGSKKK